MSDRHVVVVGSGASGVHFALSVLERGWRVTMVDVGRAGPHQPLPDATFEGLKERLPDPVGYFLGRNFAGVMLPDFGGEYYGIPPHKQYVFEAPDDFRWSATGFSPLFSFAQGGLAQAWTGGCYPFNEGELAEFPLGYDDLAPHYSEVARRIGITGIRDDLAQFMPVHDHLLEPLRLDAHSSVLLGAYARKRAWLNGRLGCYLGRTRVATLTQSHGERDACTYLGRCLWGCPRDALYTPVSTLHECQRHPAFTYRGGLRASHVRRDSAGGACVVVAAPANGGTPLEIRADRVALAAGALCSTEIFLRSMRVATDATPVLGGLMDNRQLLVPFLSARMLGRRYDPDTYQYHLLGMGFVDGERADYVHCQITTLKAALMHPIIQRLPLDLRTATVLARATHGALGVVNVNLCDRRRPENTVTLSDDPAGGERLVIRYEPAPEEPATLRRVIRRVRRALWALGAVVPPGMLHVRPMGASVHYAGTLPMTHAAEPWTTTPHCESRDFPGLYLVDGATFPFLPSKNITFTLMANAVRVARAAF